MRVSRMVDEAAEYRVQAKGVNLISVERVQLVSATGEDGELVWWQRRQSPTARRLRGVDGEAGPGARSSGLFG